MRIFLDVGAWIGDTAKEVLESKHQFDKIYCFEPQIDLCEIIKQINNDKIIVCEYGLWKETNTLPLYMVKHTEGATLYSDKFKEETKHSEIKTIKASDWFKENLKLEDFVVLKMNCEGAECDILDDLFESGEYTKISALIVDFDARKIPSLQHRMQAIKEKIKKSKIPNICIYNDKNYKAHNEALQGYIKRTRPYKRYKWYEYCLDKLIQ